MKSIALKLCVLGLVALAFVGCSIFQGKGPQVVQGGVDVAACILEHINLSPAEVVTACDGVALEDVNKILSAHRDAMQREGYVPGPSASACPTAKP